MEIYQAVGQNIHRIRKAQQLESGCGALRRQQEHAGPD